MPGRLLPLYELKAHPAGAVVTSGLYLGGRSKR